MASSSSSSSSSSSRLCATPPLQRDVQIRDLRLFQRNMAVSLNALRALRRRYQCVLFLMVLSTVYWTWRLNARLSSALPRTAHEELRLWCAWAVLGVAPLVVFVLTGMYRKTVVEPSRFVEQLNRSLEPLNVVYSKETGVLHRRVLSPPVRHLNRQPPRRILTA